ncbi:hypothetical protein GQ44DRAFT_626370 [Phaeosphaeriaceae sp. PMI808]|nr:hypothetical protein GQ44DRAFT_626370 [Phaeosphaeriaceae sp. PMI808]
MRSFQQTILFLFALFVCAFAQDNEAYDSTVYITSTVYRVNTVTLSSSPSGSVANQTSTIHASHPTAAVVTSMKPNGTLATPTGAKPSQAQFTGAAAALNVNAYIVALVAGATYLIL